MQFKRYEGNPIIPRTPGTFYSIHAANPDLLLFKGKYYLYFRGQAEEGYDQIGVCYSNPEEFDGIHWDMCPENPIIPVGKNFSDFDSNYILDPAAIEIGSKVYLYYSAHSKDKSEMRFSTGLAISEDGMHFEKIPRNPVIKNAICPEVVKFDDCIYLFYQRLTNNEYFEIYCSKSKDGIHFSEEQKIFGPSGIEGAFDKFSISTVRIWRDEKYFYLTYGGCDKYFDYPPAIGLARSKNLVNWERYPGNPIFKRNDPGSWDEAAMWFATLHKINNTYYLWYEGVGSGIGLETPESREASRKCREEDYGGYKDTSFSQIGLATYIGEIPEW